MVCHLYKKFLQKKVVHPTNVSIESRIQLFAKECNDIIYGNASSTQRIYDVLFLYLYTYPDLIGHQKLTCFDKMLLRKINDEWVPCLHRRLKSFDRPIILGFKLLKLLYKMDAKLKKSLDKP